MNRSKTSSGAIEELAEVFAAISDKARMIRLFEELFTPAERSTFELRWELLKSLRAGETQREIAEKFGISLCKITRGSKILKDKNSELSKILSELDNK